MSSTALALGFLFLVLSACLTFFVCVHIPASAISSTNALLRLRKEQRLLQQPLNPNEAAI